MPERRDGDGDTVVAERQPRKADTLKGESYRLRESRQAMTLFTPYLDSTRDLWIGTNAAPSAAPSVNCHLTESAYLRWSNFEAVSEGKRGGSISATSNNGQTFRVDWFVGEGCAREPLTQLTSHTHR